MKKLRRTNMRLKQNMMTAKDVATVLGVSIGTAYKVIRKLNHELEENGYIIVSGKIPKAYWEKKFYGVNEERKELIHVD